MKKLFIIFAVLCLAAPAMAADWNFYGSARMWTGTNSLDKEANRTAFLTTMISNGRTLGNYAVRCQCNSQRPNWRWFSRSVTTAAAIYHRKISKHLPSAGGKISSAVITRPCRSSTGSWFQR